MRRFASGCLLSFMVLCGLTAGVLWYVFFVPHLPVGVIRRQAEFDGRNVRLLLMDLSQMGVTWELAYDKTGKSVKKWREESGADLVFNGAYFDETGNPSGFFSLNGEVGSVSWPSVEAQQEPASYTFLTEVFPDDLRFTYLPDRPREAAPENDAFLSFPTLLFNGESVVREDSKKYSARTMLAETAAGHDYLIVTEKGGISLFEAAAWLQAQPEHFMIAGNLDGGPSTGVSLENGFFDIEDLSAPVTSVLLGRKIRE